jgi:hypothetical protein
MKKYGGMNVYIHISLTLTIPGGDWSDKHHGCFTTRESAPGTHWIGGWVSPRIGVEDMEKRKCLVLSGLKLQPVIQPVASRYADCTIPAPRGQ